MSESLSGGSSTHPPNSTKRGGRPRGRGRGAVTSPATLGSGSDESLQVRRDGRPRPQGRPKVHQDEPVTQFEAGGSHTKAGVEADHSHPQIHRNGPSHPPGRQRARLQPTSPERDGEVSSLTAPGDPQVAGPSTSRRRKKFNSSLTQPVITPTADTSDPPSWVSVRALPKANDLTSRLIYELSTQPYPDCLICFASIHPLQPTWSCSPSMPISSTSDDEGETPRATETVQCCWATFHLKCIRSWASKSVKDMEEAWRARGETRVGEWRCPGCQSKRAIVPTIYKCFCGALSDPKPPRLATPHSCASPCSRPCVCGHSCPLACHPGPCPPCQVTTQLPCHCGKEIISLRCARLAPGKTAGLAAADLSCGKVCDRPLGCGNHRCKEICHLGPCSPCQVRQVATCYCDKAEKELACGQGRETECAARDEGQVKHWVGRYECENICGRAFDCGIHTCSKPCHPPSFPPAPCPSSPSLVTHCPCGKYALSPSSVQFFPPGTLVTRNSCTDPIPTCESICMKPLDGCTHACSIRCHTGPCPPCKIMLVRPCRCGSTTRNVPCYEDQARSRGGDGVEEVLCDRPCRAMRACGKHQCNRLCCPLASLAGAMKGKGKKKATADQEVVDESGWHECDLVCGKLLACGNHHCELKDHRGACPSCLRSSFEEMICNCGHTILEPPIPCGTRMNCHYPCARPPPPCGHPKSTHACHEDPTPCPPCPFLASKLCACGKKTVDNVQCSQEKVSCGTPCGKLLSCGFHHCERLCHGDACGACHAICGKPRKLCLPAHHPCTLSCHAPATCSEAEPCRAVITLTCPCGRIRQSAPCGRSMTNPAGQEGSQRLKCSNECLIAQRNARLAEALGINPDRTGSGEQATYNDDLITFAKADPKFCTLVEKTFADFISSNKKSQILPHMPVSRRKFVHDLAIVYRMDTQMVDQEPNRSVQLIRRIDSRIPTPLLSSTVNASARGMANASLGRLADLRAPTAQQARSRPSPSATPPPAVGSSSGGAWRSVVVRQPQTQPNSSWGLPDRATTPTARASPSPVPQRPLQRQSQQTAELANSGPAEDVPDSWEDEA